MLISGSVTSKAQKFYDGGSVWRRAKKLYKTLRNDIHVSYCEVKQEGLLTLSGQNTVEDNKAAILQRYWRNIGSKTHVDLEQGEEEEEEEVEPAPGLIPESAAAAAAAATATDETAMQEVGLTYGPLGDEHYYSYPTISHCNCYIFDKCTCQHIKRERAGARGPGDARWHRPRAG